MISVEELEKWIKDHAEHRTVSFPKGWLRVEELMYFVRQMESDHSSFVQFLESFRNNLP